MTRVYRDYKTHCQRNSRRNLNFLMGICKYCLRYLCYESHYSFGFLLVGIPFYYSTFRCFDFLFKFHYIFRFVTVSVYVCYEALPPLPEVLSVSLFTGLWRPSSKMSLSFFWSFSNMKLVLPEQKTSYISSQNVKFYLGETGHLARKLFS